MDISEYIDLLKKINLNYKINEQENQYNEVDGLSSILKNKLNEAKIDKRWTQFKECLAQKIEWYSINDLTTFSYSLPCFKIIAILNIDSQYIIQIFVSVISNYFAFKIKEKPLTIIDISTIKDEIVNYPEINSNIKDLFNKQNIFMDLKEKQMKLKGLLESIPEFYKLFKDETETIYSLNEYPANLKDCMAKVLDCQTKIFKYKPLDSKFANNIVPGVTTNLKVEGTATLFDCVFTDVI